MISRKIIKTESAGENQTLAKALCKADGERVCEAVFFSDVS